jgi:hypothetical protein
LFGKFLIFIFGYVKQINDVAMKFTYEMYEELFDVNDALDALKNGYYDTHNLDYILEMKDEYEATVERLTKKLPIEGSKLGDYYWDFENECLVHINVEELMEAIRQKEFRRLNRDSWTGSY